MLPLQILWEEEPAPGELPYCGRADSCDGAPPQSILAFFQMIVLGLKMAIAGKTVVGDGRESAAADGW